MSTAVVVSGDARGFAQEISVGPHRLLADEPASAGGTDTGPDPYGYLLAALGSCTSMTIALYARRKQWPLERQQIREGLVFVKSNYGAVLPANSPWLDQPLIFAIDLKHRNQKLMTLYPQATAWLEQDGALVPHPSIEPPRRRQAAPRRDAVP